ncbi:MAG TPA: PAS domain-containing protein [Burkholderiales bacterium]|nr:PAS domain-containing protein [Burkholderiales bacterium]
MYLPQDGSLFASLRDIRDVVEKKLRAAAGEPPEGDFGRLRALELALEELNVLWEELKDQSDRLSTEGRRYADLFDFAPDAYLVTDPYGTITEANHAAVGMLGVPVAYLLGKQMASFISMSHRAHYRQQLITLIAEGGATRQAWRSVVAPREATEIAVEFSVAGVRHPHSSMLYLCWLLRPAARARSGPEA